MAIQETELVGDNAEEVDADMQREPLRLMQLSNGEGLSTCQVVDVSVPLQHPAIDVTTSILQTSAMDAHTLIYISPVSRVMVSTSQTTIERVPISQVLANDIPGRKTLVDVHISKLRLNPPDLNANQVAPRRSACECGERCNK